MSQKYNDLKIRLDSFPPESGAFRQDKPAFLNHLRGKGIPKKEAREGFRLRECLKPIVRAAPCLAEAHFL